MFSAGDAARTLGISPETLRRWDRAGRIRVERDPANRRRVPSDEIERILGERGDRGLSARNEFPGVVRSVTVDGLLAEVEIEVSRPVRVVATITARSARDMGLRPGMDAAGIVKASAVLVRA